MEPPPVGKTFCDGQTMSDAEINQCGFCVRGSTGRTIDFGLDKCGICGGTDDCLGCDGRPNSGAIWDVCKTCLNPDASEFNRNCTRLGKPDNMLISAEKEQNVAFNTAGLLNTTVKLCNFTKWEQSSPLDRDLAASAVWFQQIKDELKLFAKTPTTLKSGNYSLQCTLIGILLTCVGYVHIMIFSTLAFAYCGVRITHIF